MNDDTGIPNAVNEANTLNNLIKQLTESFSGLSSGVGTVIDQLSKATDKLLKSIDAPEALRSLGSGIDKVKDKVTELANSSPVKILFDIQLDDKALEGVMDSVDDIGKALKNVGVEGGINLAKLLTTKLSADFLQNSPVTKFARDTDKYFADATARAREFMAVSGDLLPAILPIGDAFNRDGTADPFDTMGTAMKSLAYSTGELGVATKETDALLAEMTARGISTGQVFRETSKGSNALIDTMRISKALGIESATITDMQSKMLRARGVQEGELRSKIGDVIIAQRLSNLTTKETFDAVGSVTDKMRFYGDTTTGAAKALSEFNHALGPGNELLGRDLFSQVIGSIEQMSMGMKGFLAMQSDIGRGGGIGAIFDFEEAMEAGDFSGIMDSITQQLERFGGGEVLTRKEAQESGREMEYLQQRQLLSTITGIQGAGELEKLMQALQKRDSATVGTAFGRGDETAEAVAKTGQELITGEIGEVQTAINKLRASEGEAVGDLLVHYRGLSSVIGGLIGKVKEEVTAHAVRVTSAVASPVATEESVAGLAPALDRAESGKDKVSLSALDEHSEPTLRAATSHYSPPDKSVAVAAGAPPDMRALTATAAESTSSQGRRKSEESSSASFGLSIAAWEKTAARLFEDIARMKDTHFKDTGSTPAGEPQDTDAGEGTVEIKLQSPKLSISFAENELKLDLTDFITDLNKQVMRALEGAVND